MLELRNKKILVTGGGGFLGSRLVAKLVERGVPRENISVPRKETADLRLWGECIKAVEGRNIVFHLAGTVGGIGFNQERPAELFFDNSMMGIQLMEASRRAGIEKFIALGTICSYPKHTPVPFKEDDLWNGYPEETNAPYGLAKKMLLVQAQAYRAEYGWNAIFLLPVNLYGPGDSFDPARSHVIPALIRKFSEAKKKGDQVVEVWGTGEATREFLYVDDAAEGVVRAAEQYDKPDPVNLGSGCEMRVKDLAEKIAGLVGYAGEIRWDRTKPDGQPRRLLDTARAEREFGFRAMTPFEDGLRKTIDWWQAQ